LFALAILSLHYVALTRLETIRNDYHDIASSRRERREQKALFMLYTSTRDPLTRVIYDCDTLISLLNAKKHILSFIARLLLLGVERCYRSENFFSSNIRAALTSCGKVFARRYHPESKNVYEQQRKFSFNLCAHVVFMETSKQGEKSFLQRGIFFSSIFRPEK
jgi:hypothetical protein